MPPSAASPGSAWASTGAWSGSPLPAWATTARATSWRGSWGTSTPPWTSSCALCSRSPRGSSPEGSPWPSGRPSCPSAGAALLAMVVVSGVLSPWLTARFGARAEHARADAEGQLTAQVVTGLSAAPRAPGLRRGRRSGRRDRCGGRRADCPRPAIGERVRARRSAQRACDRPDRRGVHRPGRHRRRRRDRRRRVAGHARAAAPGHRRRPVRHARRCAGHRAGLGGRPADLRRDRHPGPRAGVPRSTAADLAALPRRCGPGRPSRSHAVDPLTAAWPVGTPGPRTTPSAGSTST